MKNLLPVFIIGMMFCSVFGVAGITNGDDSFRSTVMCESITVSEPVVEMVGDFVQVDLPESSSMILLPGKPILPVVSRVFRLPFGSRVGDVDIMCFGYTKVVLPGVVQPAPEPIPDAAMGSINVVLDQEVYRSSDIYPSSCFDYDVGVGLNEGERVVFVSVRWYPIRYIPAENVIVINNQVDIRVEYEQPYDLMGFPDVYDLLVIAPQEFTDAVQPLVDHKNGFGMATVVKPVEEIYEEYQGRDQPEQIKYFIKDAIETWNVKYVLLVGGMKGQRDDWYLPVRYTNNHAGKGFETSFISDLYYADIYKIEGNETIFEDWDSNGNGVFAEFTLFNKDILDCRPDVYVSRIACRSLSEVDIMVEKIINYEKNPADPTWFNRMLLVAGDTYPDAREPEAYEAEIDTDLSASYMDGFIFERLWTSLGTLKGQADVERAINQGAGFIHMAGHANPSVLVTNTPQGKNGSITILKMYNMPLVNAMFALLFQGKGIPGFVSKLTESRIPNLNNLEKQPVVVIGGCHNIQFNTSIMNIIKHGFTHAYGYGIYVPKCFSWYLTSLENGGAIATMGNTGLGMGIPGYNYTEGLDGWLFPRFFYHYGVKDTQILGESFGGAITDYVNEFAINNDDATRQMVEQWALLGDASLFIGGYH
jgi:hypothetical protein